MKARINRFIKLSLISLVLFACKPPFVEDKPNANKDDSIFTNNEVEIVLPEIFHGVQAPLNVKVSQGTYLDKILISWEAPIKAIYYQIFRSREESAGYQLLADNCTSMSYQDFILLTDQGVSFYYMVRAVGDDGLVSEFSEPISGYASELEPPQDITASKKEYYDAIELSWIPSQGVGIDGYLIERTEQNNGEYAEFKILKTTSSDFRKINNRIYYKDSGLEEYKEYFYRITAIVEEDRSKASELVSGHTSEKSNLPLPNITGTEVDETGITIIWGYNADYIFEVQRSEHQSVGYESLYIGQNNVFVDNSIDLLSGGDFYYRVRFLTDSSTGYFTYTEEALSLYVLAPEYFEVVNVDKADALKLVWEAKDNTSEYIVKKYLEDEECDSIAVSASETTYLDNNIQAGKFYTYKLQRISSAGKASGFTDSQTGISMIRPLHFTKESFLPTNTVSDNGLKLSWTAINHPNFDNVSYFIYRDGVKIAETSEDYFVDANALYDKQYNYRLSAFTELAGESSLTMDIPCVRDISLHAMYTEFVDTFREATIALGAAYSNVKDKTVNGTKGGTAKFETKFVIGTTRHDKFFTFDNYVNNVLVLNGGIERNTGKNNWYPHNGPYNGTINLGSFNNNYRGAVIFNNLNIEYTPKDSGTITIIQKIGNQEYQVIFNANDDFIKNQAFFVES